MIKIIQAKKKPYEQAVEFLPIFKDKLMAQSPAVREKTREIRLRAGRCITLETNADRHNTNIAVTPESLRELIEIFCNYSLYSYSRQLSEGFVTLEGGHRAGFCGTAVTDNGNIQAVRDITSINLRIAREFHGCSDRLFSLLTPESIKCLLIIGRPVSAKTTVLRDFARNLSRDYKVCVIDERGEIAAKSKGNFTADLGPNTDVLDNFPKKKGFITALRAMSPDFIVCDEIADDGNSVAECLNCGVGLILTAHCGGFEEFLHSSALFEIKKHVNYLALLGTGKNIGQLQGLWRKNENRFSDILYNCGNGGRTLPLGGA